MSLVQVRPEHPGDEPAIASVTDAAFGRPDESQIIAAIRGSGRSAISLVATDGPTVVGHILFTPIVVESPVPVEGLIGLGPMAVSPSRQRKGIGTRLVQEGLRACARGGYRAVVVVGHPDFYPRFGFRSASSHGLRCEFTVPDDVFMAVELTPGALAGVNGLVRYVPEFGGGT
jgi:putative acetyltransferase